MPHVILEFSGDLATELQIEQLLDTLHETIFSSGLFHARNIKIRAYPTPYYRVAGSRQPFMHLQLRIHHGRSEEQKRALSGRLLHAMQDHAWPAEVMTVEVVEMEHASYSKYSTS